MIEVVHLAPGKPKSETPDDEPWLIVEASVNGGSLVRAALGRLPVRLCSTPLLRIMSGARGQPLRLRQTG
jgi:hypothetical protein